MHRTVDASMIRLMPNQGGAHLSTIPYQRVGADTDSATWRLVLWAVVIWTALLVLSSLIDIAAAVLRRWGGSDLFIELHPGSFVMMIFYAHLGVCLTIAGLGGVALGARRTGRVMVSLALFLIILDATSRLWALVPLLWDAASGREDAPLVQVLRAAFFFALASTLAIVLAGTWERRLDEQRCLARAVLLVRVMMLIVGALAALSGVAQLTTRPAPALELLPTWSQAVSDIVWLLGGSWIMLCAALRVRWLRWAVWLLLLIQAAAAIAWATESLARVPTAMLADVSLRVITSAASSLARTVVLVMFVDHLFVHYQIARPGAE